MCFLAGLIIGMTFDDKIDSENTPCQIVNNRRDADTVWVKDTVIKEIVKIKWRSRNVRCCDSICCSHKK